jgi:lactoylglutathione lyase
MSFCWCTVHVKDLNTSIKFYEEIARIHVVRRFEGGKGMEIAFLGDGETKLELIGGAGSYSGDGIAIGFTVDDLDEKLAFVKDKGIAIHSGPFSPNPTTRFFYVQDPDGLLVQFVQKA